MTRYKTKLQIEKVPRHTSKWTLIGPLEYFDSVEGLIEVPVKFETDLATNWVRGRHDEASVLHDYVLFLGWPWARSNALMNRAMINSEVRDWHRRIIMIAVTLNRFVHWVKGCR